MKKLIIILIILTSCSTLKEQRILETNLSLVRTKYPNHKVTQHRYFGYIFQVCKGKDTVYTEVRKGKVKLIKF